MGIKTWNQLPWMGTRTSKTDDKSNSFKTYFYLMQKKYLLVQSQLEYFKTKRNMSREILVPTILSEE